MRTPDHKPPRWGRAQHNTPGRVVQSAEALKPGNRLRSATGDEYVVTANTPPGPFPGGGGMGPGVIQARYEGSGVVFLYEAALTLVYLGDA